MIGDETFVIVSVTYTDANGKQDKKTFDAMNKIAQIPAAAVTNEITINGTYTPANALITATIYVSGGGSSSSQNGTPMYKDGNSTMTVAKDKLKSNKEYAVTSQVGQTADNATVNGKSVKVDGKTLSIAAP